MFGFFYKKYTNSETYYDLYELTGSDIEVARQNIEILFFIILEKRYSDYHVGNYFLFQVDTMSLG
ncbi:unnamed protein product [Commensalibacter communis]|nr:unnamed protein product [Commensalibacter communis]CAI3931945.1 unnamed protein product [Commensalibacter communis]